MLCNEVFIHFAVSGRHGQRITFQDDTRAKALFVEANKDFIRITYVNTLDLASTQENVSIKTITFITPHVLEFSCEGIIQDLSV